MGAAEVEGFLTHLAVAKRVSASTQNQAKSAVLFLYKEVLGEPLPWLEGIESAKRPARLPVVLTREEVESILTHLRGTVGLMIRLLYGTGMRIMECVPLRVKDVDFTRGEIVVRQGKGRKDRMTVLPQNDRGPAQRTLGRVKKVHGGSGSRLRRGLCPRCPRPQVSRRATPVGMAVCVSLPPALRGPAFRGGAPALCGREGAAKGDATGCATGGH